MGVILYPLAVLAAIVLGAFGAGVWLPVAHVASRTKRLPVRPEIVWGLINDPVEEDQPRLLVTKIIGESAFGGTWTFEIAPEGHDASTVTITERGEIHNPLFRTVIAGAR